MAFGDYEWMLDWTDTNKGALFVCFSFWLRVLD